MQDPSFTGPNTENRSSGSGEVLVIGGCHMDVLGRSSGAFEPGTSCPGQVGRKPGGVARNVATLLARAGAKVQFCSVVGADETGQNLLDGLRQAGVAITHVAKLSTARTGTYLAVHDEHGELVAAVSDLSIYDDFRLPASLTVEAPALVFADANIPASCLEELAVRFGDRLCVDAISRAKAPRLKGILGSKALLVSNLPSISALLNASFSSARQAVEALAAAGVSHAVVSAGGAALAVLQEGTVTCHVPEPVAVVDVTGTGDAQIAGLLLGRLAGLDLNEAVAVGMRAARAALGCSGALERLPDAILAAAGWRAPP